LGKRCPLKSCPSPRRQQVTDPTSSSIKFKTKFRLYFSTVCPWSTHGWRIYDFEGGLSYGRAELSELAHVDAQLLEQASTAMESSSITEPDRAISSSASAPVATTSVAEVAGIERSLVFQSTFAATGSRPEVAGGAGNQRQKTWKRRATPPGGGCPRSGRGRSGSICDRFGALGPQAGPKSTLNNPSRTSVFYSPCSPRQAPVRPSLTRGLPSPPGPTRTPPGAYPNSPGPGLVAGPFWSRFRAPGALRVVRGRPPDHRRLGE
jgi:hypothetical protein